MLPTSLIFNMVTALLLRRALLCATDALGAKPAFCGASPGQRCGIKTSPVVLEEPPSADSVVSYEQLKAMLSSHSVQLFDVRNPDEFQAGHISGATNVPLGDLADALKMAPAQFKQQFRVEAPSKQDENIVFHCQKGRRSATALEIAHGLGFSRARHYVGGYAEWAEREGGPSQ
ncbi:hypothetical protein MATL_G00021490 [Megalops atlanticus]|uniref:Rhodanese domain-containing protein n=1 Tax=Megalops atlanticus TaxID=7932 RepID=A0A9D3QGS4_MEGAT|nr:hypothetical protein MATL_G00021490 [Megalops atlanticus]